MELWDIIDTRSSRLPTVQDRNKDHQPNHDFSHEAIRISYCRAGCEPSSWIIQQQRVELWKSSLILIGSRDDKATDLKGCLLISDQSKMSEAAATK